MQKIMSAQAAREKTKTKEEIDQVQLDHWLRILDGDIRQQQDFGYFESTHHSVFTPKLKEQLTKILTDAGYEVLFTFFDSDKGLQRLDISWKPSNTKLPNTKLPDELPSELTAIVQDGMGNMYARTLTVSRAMTMLYPDGLTRKELARMAAQGLVDQLTKEIQDESLEDNH